MSLHDTPALVIEANGAAESLPDPTLVAGRTHELHADVAVVLQVWSSVGATPFLINGVPTVTLTLIPGETRNVYSNGINWVVLPGPGDGLILGATTNPVRALNTNYQPNLTRPVLVTATVSIGGTTTLLSGDDGRIELRSDAGPVPATVRGSVRNRTFQGLGVTVGTNVVVEAPITFIVPAGHFYRLHTVTLVAAPVFTLVRVTEQVL